MHFGFNTAVRGLLASQRALYTTNHNIDNANTKGYSRQSVEQRATNPYYMPGTGFLGTGTEVYNVNRARDSFVDFKFWNETAPKGEWEIKKNQLMEIEKLMGEPTDNSFRSYMDGFYQSLEDMSTNPSDISYREPVRENARAFTRHINETAKRLENLKKETKYEIETKIKEINNIAEQIGEINKQIYSSEVGDRPANDLRDRRELLVDQMAKIVPVKVNDSPAGKYTVSVQGISIVDHYDVNTMSFKEVEDDGGNKEFKVLWENGGQANIESGELKGLMDMFKGNGDKNTYRGIPYFIEQLDKFVQGFAEKFNAVHSTGYGLGIDGVNGTTGNNFFVGSANEVDDINLTAATFRLSDEILEDIRNIAAAGNAEGADEDNTNMLKLIAQRNDKEFFQGGVSQGTPDDFIKSILASMAVDSLQANRIFETQELIQQNIGIKRESISGVFLDEEMSDMIRFQHVYVAASKMISTMDMILDITVNRLGMVGR